MYYKLGQACVTNWGSFVLLQIRANVVTNWGSYYKLGQPLLQNRAAITNCGIIYYKLGQVLQIRTIITNWGITDANDIGPAKFRTEADSNQEQLCYYNRNKRDTSFNYFLAVRKQASTISDITFSIVKLIDKTNKNTNIYFEINNELSDFNNDNFKRPVQRISEGDNRGDTCTNGKQQGQERHSFRSNGRISKKPRILS